jgi:hypothetical protein
VTHHWDDGAWKKLDEEFTLTYTVSGNTLTGVDNEGNPVTLTKGGGGNNAAKTLVITAIPADVFGYHTDAEDEGVAIFPQGTSSQDAFEQKGVVAVVSFSNSNVTASKSAPFTLTLPLHLPSSGKTSWTGSGTYDVYVGLSGDGGHYYKAGSVTISAATTTIPFTSFTELNLPK